MSQSSVSAFGALAERLASGFSRADPVVVFDHTGCAEALRECAARKFRGEKLYVRAVLAREHTVRADAVAPTILSTYAGVDERRVAFEQAFAGALQVNNQFLRDIPAYMPPTMRLIQATLRLADALVVTSESERRRIQDLAQADPPTQTLALIDARVPLGSAPSTAPKDAVVIWAPDLTGDAASSFAAALAELRIPLIVVSQTPLREERLGQWYPLDRAAQALQRAKLIVDASPYGCDAIRPLVTWNVPIVCDVESGAQESFSGVRTFNRQLFGSIHEAAIAQLGGTAPQPRIPAAPSAIESVRSTLPTDGPLVSVILPTLDRPHMVREAIESIERQNYRNVEPIVVIDGGPSLANLQPLFPRVRFIHMPENNPIASTHAAFAAATGTYIAILNDDDLFFPDHIAALVAALERSGANVAHADVMTAYLQGDEDDWTLYGLESNMSRSTDSTSFLVSNQIGATSTLFRRSCLEGSDPFDASIPYYRDYELWLRLSLKYDFVHVERITSCYTIRNQGAKQQSVMWRDQTLVAYEAIYARHQVQGRPVVQQRREQVLQSARSGHMDLQSYPAGEVRPTRWPFRSNPS